MPKSRFNARHHARSARHNPLASGSSKKDGNSASAAGAGQQQPSSTTSRDVIPLLSQLPLPGEKKAAAQPAPGSDADSEFIWALSSVSALLCSRPSRKTLLAPNHRLAARLVQAIRLSSSSSAAASTALEMRKEAAGALRNLCVEGLGHGAAGLASAVAKDQRRLADNLVSEGAIEVAVEQLLWAAKCLSGESTAADDSNAAAATAAALPALPDKPLDQMNKKERRLAAKLAAASKNALSPSTNGDAAAGTAISRRMDPDDVDQLLALYALAENAVTILWCLCEASSGVPTTSALNSAAVETARMLCQAVGGAFLTAQQKQGAAETAAPGAAAARERDIITAARQLALQSANALCALTDDNLAFAVALCGLENASVTLQVEDADGDAKGKHRAKARKAKPSLGHGVFEVPPDAAVGKENLASLLTGISALGPPVQRTAQTHEALVLGVACASVVRNVLASLPRAVRGTVEVSVPSGSIGDVRLEDYERTHVLPALLDLLESAALLPSTESVESGSSALGRIAQLAGEALAAPRIAGASSSAGKTPEEIVAALNAAQNGADGNEEEDSDVPRSTTARRAEEALQAAQLAFEVLAEVLPALPATASGEAAQNATFAGPKGAEGPDGMEEDDEPSGADDEDEWEEEGEADEEGDDAMDEDEIPIDDDVDADDGIAEKEGGEALGGSASTAALANGFTGGALAQSVSVGKLPDRLTRLAHSSTLQESFPPLTAQGADDVVAQQRGRAARSLSLRSLSALSNLLLALAAHAPPPPSRAAPPGTPEAARTAVVRAWMAPGTEAGEALRRAWRECFALAAQCAGLPVVAQEAAAGTSEVPASVKEQAVDARALIEACVGSMWSIARLLEGDLPIFLPSGGPDAGTQQLDVLSALRAAYVTAHSDGMRVKCLGTLGCLARSPTQADGGVGANAVVGPFLVDVLEALPPVHSKGSDTGAATAAMTTADAMTATLDALFDIYADENAVWDAPVFRALGFKDRLRRVLPRAQAVVKRIDKRVNRSLWSSAATAVGNLSDFVKYRDGLGF